MTKPDCTGQRFGRLVVLGKGGRKKDTNRDKTQQLWQLQCDCGKVIELLRSQFATNGHVSCGCKRKLGLVITKKPYDITGQKFGSLTALFLTGKKDKFNKPTWLMECTCGNARVLSYSILKTLLHSCVRINCGDKSKHPNNYLQYPPTPSPYPDAAAQLVTKYLKETECSFNDTFVDSAVEDEKRDSLIRAAWIITWRRSLGEVIPEKYERGIIKKYMKYASNTVKKNRKSEKKRYGLERGQVYTGGNYKPIGVAMTELTSSNYPVIETQENISRCVPIRKLKFKRC